MKQQRGFTLIELVMVIVIIGILAAVAIPRFVNMNVQAGNASAQGVAGALSSASAINFAARSAGNAAGVAVVSGTTTCAALTPLLTGGALPADVAFVAPAAVITCVAPAGPGGVSTADCSVFHAQGTPAGFPVTAICVN